MAQGRGSTESGMAGERISLIDLYECLCWNGRANMNEDAPRHVAEALGAIKRVGGHVSLADRLVFTIEKRRTETFSHISLRPLPDPEKLSILRFECSCFRYVPVSTADAEEMVTWETAQVLSEMAENINRNSLELLSLYERTDQLGVARKFREQWEVLAQVVAKGDQVSDLVQKYRSAKRDVFDQKLADWREAHKRMMGPWKEFLKSFPDAVTAGKMEDPEAEMWFDKNAKDYMSKAEITPAVIHIASTVVAGEGWLSKYEGNPRKMALYQERRAQQAFASKMWAVDRERLGD